MWAPTAGHTTRLNLDMLLSWNSFQEAGDVSGQCLAETELHDKSGLKVGAAPHHAFRFEQYCCNAGSCQLHNGDRKCDPQPQEGVLAPVGSALIVL